jgi:riboflavin kinase/FMN adenylyltransferase
MDATEYVEKILVNNFHPKKIVIGYDHRFGKDRKGNIELLREAFPQNIIMK